MSLPKPPTIPRREVQRLWDRVLQRWKDELRPSVANIWIEEVWYLFNKLGYLKEKPHGKENEQSNKIDSSDQ